MARSKGLFGKWNRKATEGPDGATLGGNAQGDLPPQRPARGESELVNRVEEFLSEKGKRWSANTIELYRRYLQDLARWLGQRPSVSVDEITTRMLVRWLDARPYWGASTQYTAIIAARSFFRWRLGRDGSPAERLPLPRRPVRPHRTLNEVTARKLLASIDTSRMKGIRDLALITLLLDTGLRASEVCRLRVEDVDLRRRTLSCRRKGGKWRSSVFSDYTQSCIEHWLAVREAVAAKSIATLFVGIGGITPGHSLTRDGLRSVMQHLGRKAAIGALSPHDFRRTMATLSIRAGAPLPVTKAQGAWDDVKTMERYTQDIEPRDFDPYSPVRNLMGLRGEDEEEPTA